MASNAIEMASNGIDRPSVSVVMPFAGDAAARRAATQTLCSLVTRPGDELILVDNSGVAGPVDGVVVVGASGERSPAYARNTGAARACRDWILFLDADCRAPIRLLDAYFREPVPAWVGALAGEVSASVDGDTLATRYGAARNFLSQEAHLAHPYCPRAVAANLLVRRVAFEQIGGFYEGVRAAEDTDLSWRLQQAGWRLELRSQARVEHRYRATVSELRRQWRGYAAGRAWLGRRYEGFVPEPAVRRAARRAGRLLHRPGGDWLASRPRPAGGGPTHRPPASRGPAAGRLERGRYFALDALLAADELAGLALSNRPARPSDPARRRLRRRGPREDAGRARTPARVVLVADRFPDRLDPLTELASTIQAARVEARARPAVVDVQVARSLQIDYREDDGLTERAEALLALLIRHPLRCVLDLARRRGGGPPLRALAPAARRLQRDRQARVHPLGGGEVRATAGRLGALAGRQLDVGG